MVDKQLLTFDEKEHLYRYGGQTVISVTQTLNDLSDFSKVPKHYLKQAIDRGNEVHFAVELFNKFGAIEIKEELRGYFNSYLKFKEMFKHESLLNEFRFYSQLGYAGTVDSYGLVMGKKTVIDYKTCAKLDKQLIDKTGLQLSAYKNGLEENNYEVEQGLVIQLIPNKSPKLNFYTSDELNEYFNNFKKMLEYKKIIKFYGGN